MQRSFFLCFYGLLLLGCWACSEGRPIRKKMPEWEGGPGGAGMTPYTISDTSFLVEGHRRHYLCYTLPLPAYDSIVWNLVRAYEPLAPSLLRDWTAQDKDGILIDLRTGSSTIRQVDFELDKVGATTFHLPITLIWDAASAERARGYLDAAQSLSGIHLTTHSSSL